METPGYHYIPAAVNPLLFGGLGLYVRYHHKNQGDKIEILAETTNSLLVKTPDRDLMFVRDLHLDTNSRPVNENWDELIMLTPSSAIWKDYLVDYGMVNYTNHIKKPMLQLKRPKGLAPSGTKWLSDSGGFQIVNGKIDYLDPVKIAEWYNKYVDIGIALDIPVFGDFADYQELLIKSGKAQKANNLKMLEVMDENTELMNVIHGSDIKSFLSFHDLVQTDGVKRVCIADLYRGTTLDAVSVLHELIEALPKEYTHYHILGIFNTRVTAILARSIKKFFPNVTLTSDSTSYLQAAHGWQFCVQKNIDAPFERLEIGANWSAAKYPSVNRHIPCSCPICSRVKYMDVFAFTRGLPVYFLLYHNMFEMVRYAKNMNQFAGQLDNKEYRELTKKVLANNNSVKEAMNGLDFLEMVEDKGFKKAKAAYQIHLQNNKFSHELKATTAMDLGEEVDTEHETLNQKHIRKVLDVYLGKGTEKHGKAKKSKEVREMHGATKKKRGYHHVNKVKKKAKGLKITIKKGSKKNHNFTKVLGHDRQTKDA